MSENQTRQFDDHRSFEERVFARFDEVDLRLDEMRARFEGRLGAVEIRVTKLEERQYDTKPIWEQALAAILETRADVAEFKSDVAELKSDVTELKSDVTELKSDVAELKSGQTETNASVADLKTGLIATNAAFESGLQGLRTEMQAGFTALRHDMEHELRGVARKLDALNHNLLELQADQRYVDRRLQELEENS